MKQILIMIATIAATAVVSAQQYTYDAAGRLISARYSNGMETRYTYDKNGNILKASTDVVNSVNSETPEVSAVVSPNPTSDVLNIKVAEMSGENVQVVISNARGASVLRTNASMQNGELTLDVKSLASGTYTVSVSMQNSAFGIQNTTAMQNGKQRTANASFTIRR